MVTGACLGWKTTGFFEGRPIYTDGRYPGIARAGLPLRTIIHYLLSGPYLTVDPVVKRLIDLKLSRKTFPEGWGSRCTQDVMRGVLRDMRQPGSVTTLSALLQNLGKQDLCYVAEVPATDQAFFNDLYELILSDPDQPLAPSNKWNSFCAKWGHRRSNLELKQTEYFARGDTRAYVVDSDLVRSLCGAIIQRVFQPKRVSTRKQLFTNDINPAVASNILRHTITVTPGEVLYLAISDTSGFTSSAVNLWVSLVAAITVLQQVQDVSPLLVPFVVMVQDEPLEVDLLSVLKIYCWLTVGVKCHDSSADEWYVSQGGYLGVNGNAVLSRHSQAVHLYDLRAQLRVSIYSLFQTGGDDVFSALVGKESTILETTVAVRESLTKYVGAQKELTWVCANTYSAGAHVLTSPKFCKKTLELRREDHPQHSRFTVNSLWDLPILETLLTAKPRNPQRALREFREFVSSVEDIAPKVQGGVPFIGEMALIYTMVKPIPANISETLSTTICGEGPAYRDEDGITITEGALSSLWKIPALTTSDGGLFLTTLDEKLLVAQRKRWVVLVRPRGVDGSVYVTRRESSRIARSRFPRFLSVPSALTAEGDALLRMILAERAACGV